MKKTLYLCCMVFGIAGAIITASAQQDTRPYAPVAVPLPDTLDQLYRDSATIKIGRVRVNQAGYRLGDDKYFYYVARSGSTPTGFSVINVSTGAAVQTNGALTSKNYTASGQMKIRASNNAQITAGGDTRYRMESALVSGALYEGKINVSVRGNYRVIVGSDTSAPFWISDGVYGWVRDAAIKFPAVNRCGNSDSWFHGACHLQDATQGGWHDCGDHLKESITQSFLHSMLGLASAALKDRDADHYGANHNNTLLTDGVPDVLYEARHGSQYVINAYNNAKGDVSKMITAVGGFGPDHQWWGQPEYHDRMSTERGGPPREARNEVGANIMGNFAAGLALTAKNYAVFDKRFADTSIAIAKKMYEYGKAHLDVVTQTPAYNGNAIANDKMAFAALALAWATGERKYLEELCYDKTIGGKSSNADGTQSSALFQGGWFTHTDPVFSKQTANTDWASPHMAVKWGFFRLILKDPEMCTKLGINENERKALLGRTLHNIIFDLGMVSTDGTTITLPATGLWNRSAVSYGSVWGNMHIQMDWMWNRYQFGNIFDMYCYSDMAMWMEDNGFALPGAPDWGNGGQAAQIYNLEGAKVRQAMIRQMDYMLGVNPWDVSMIFGVGAKNFNHPHHRAANPEGKNVPGAFYGYRPPVGALAGAVSPMTQGGVYEEHYDDYFKTETGIDASAVIIIPIMGLAEEDPISDPPTATVRTIYVGYDMAIIEVRQSRYGSAAIRFATDTTNFPSATVQSDSLGMVHRITLNNLSGGATYYFDALISSIVGNTTPTPIKDREDAYFKFTTLKTPQGDAEIANVKVCKVTSDSAEIFWFTPNGNYDSKVVYDTKKPPTANVQDGNVYGRPTQFHYVKIGGLKEKTTYYFYVESNGTRDDNGGQFYTFTTPVEHVEFDVRSALYSEGGHHFIGLNVINQDIKAYDSLELRLYVRAPETINVPDPATGQNVRVAFENHFAFRVDIGIKYRSDGYQDTHFKTEVDKLVESTRPIKMDDTYDPATGTWAYYIPVPLGPAEMQSGARFRLDLMLETRSPWHPYEDLMNQTPLKLLDPKIDWSFMPHSRANGEPVDYPGTPTGTKDAILDGDYWNTPINQYITVYRKGEFIWGYSPSAREQQEKKTHYEMTSQITSPLFNPDEEYVYIEQLSPTVTVRGWAQITENGVINDIWVNGAKLPDVSSVAQYDFASDRWNLAIPVQVKNTYGGNNIDVTIFGGPEAACATCYGCAFANHSFYVEFRGVEPFASSMKLLDADNAEVRDSAKIDGSTSFYVFVDDMNGNLNKDRRDTIWVSVVNPVWGDSIYIPLIETDIVTGQFMSAVPITVVNTAPSQRGANEISMDGGQTIVVTYVDATDPEDISQISLASRAEFAVPVSAYFRDSTGIGSIDLIYVKYSKELTPDALPDSLHLTVPGQTAVRVIKIPGDAITLDAGDNTLVRFYFKPAIENVTGFGVGEQMTARSFLLAGGVVRQAVVPVQDNAGLVLLEKALLMERTGGLRDTLQVTFSEPIAERAILGSTLMLRRNGEDFPITVDSVLVSSLVSNTMTLLVNPLSNRILERDSIFINPGSDAVDRLGNRPHPQNKPVPIELKSLNPRIVSGFYIDRNADGIIDIAEFTFSKPLKLNGLYGNDVASNVSISWENGAFITVNWKLDDRDIITALGEAGSGADKTVTGLRIDVGLMQLTGNAVLTSGEMIVTAKHNDFPGVTMQNTLSDNAAPVIVTATFYPGRGDSQDTMTVTFSEPLFVVQSASSFRFQYTENGVNVEYFMDVQNKNINSQPSSIQTFFVTLADTSRFPDRGDSIWINHTVTVSDTSFNQQQNENNRKAPIIVKPAPLTFKLITKPNPFRLGAASANGGKISIIARPDKKPNEELTISGKVVIYDKLGRRVRSDNLRVDLTRWPDPIYYEWDGTSDHGRLVGTGAYLITVSVEYGFPGEKKLKPEKEKALIYMLR